MSGVHPSRPGADGDAPNGCDPVSPDASRTDDKKTDPLPSVRPHTRSVGAGARILLALIAAYRLVLSPLLGRQCRYLPTCSEYGATAVRQYGAWVGGWLTFARVLRCNPFGPAGFDPVPDLPVEALRRPWRYARWTGRHMPPESRLDR